MTITEPTSTAVDEGAVDETAVEAFADKVFGAILGAQELQAMYLGDLLGWYRALGDGALTSAELAERTETSERYAREWLEHQTVSGYLVCDAPGADIADRKFRIPAAHAAVFLEPESLSHMLPFARMIVGLGKHMDELVEAYRNDTGVSWQQFGADPREGQAAANRPMFVNQLGHEYLASIDDIDRVLREGGRVADIGAGHGWSSIGVGLAYPNATVDAIDIDEPSVETARRNIAEAGVADRVTARCVDASAIADTETYDLVMALECIHDMPDPVSVLSTMRALAGDDGSVIVMDEKTGEHFTGEADPVEQMLYGFSLTCCLADGKAHDHSVETGTVMRPSTFEGYALQAGFASVEVLPIENDFFRFYRLR